MTTVLTAGDRFVLPELFERAISAVLPEHRLAFRAVVPARRHRRRGAGTDRRR